ncbi:hypothetical protein ES288_D04G066800v1 [Gossypium darwinii]|uniref:Integrase catalytic domain-containing protein n=1 Tax=Gossypium darwinii TaxID=34276 RepID=A0A5D2CTN4_GOSDA|nr:hypothetical protein ES288_D04G066800v1 [Gossypium darwinii]
MSKGKDTILVVVDKLTKYGHFLALTHPFISITVAQLYLDSIFRLHGVPEVLVSDRDRVFISQFWQENFKHLGTKLHMSIVYYTQTDGQTKVLNRCLEGYLFRMTRERSNDWYLWLT